MSSNLTDTQKALIDWLVWSLANEPDRWEFSGNAASIIFREKVGFSSIRIYRSNSVRDIEINGGFPDIGGFGKGPLLFTKGSWQRRLKEAFQEAACLRALNAVMAPVKEGGQ